MLPEETLKIAPPSADTGKMAGGMTPASPGVKRTPHAVDQTPATNTGSRTPANKVSQISPLPQSTPIAPVAVAPRFPAPASPNKPITDRKKAPALAGELSKMTGSPDNVKNLLQQLSELKGIVNAQQGRGGEPDDDLAPDYAYDSLVGMTGKLVAASRADSPVKCPTEMGIAMDTIVQATDEDLDTVHEAMARSKLQTISASNLRANAGRTL